MLAVRSHGPGDGIRIERVSIPMPKGTEVRVKVAGCGLCHTDLHIVESDRVQVERPVTLGHEIAGWVDEVGKAAGGAMAAEGLAPSDPVVVFGGWGCARCEPCLSDDENACRYRRSPGLKRDGGFAEYVLVPHPRHLVALGPDLDPRLWGPLADAGLTPWHAISRARPWLERAERVMVVGVGGLGQFAVQYLRWMECREVIAADIDSEKRERALELGADAAIDLARGTRDDLRAIVDVVFDFVGNDETLRNDARMVKRGGLVSLIGEAGGRLPFGFRQTEVEAFLTTNSWGSRRELQQVVELTRAGAIVPTVEHFPLARAEEAFDRLAAGQVGGRIILVP